VLTLRFFILASLAGICLWGLFSLLENLREPGLLRSPKTIVVKGCDRLDTPKAAQVCPQLFCQKALLESNEVARSARFEITLRRKANAAELIGGNVLTDAGTSRHFACVLENSVVKFKKIVTSTDLESLAAGSEWSL